MACLRVCEQAALRRGQAAYDVREDGAERGQEQGRRKGLRRWRGDSGELAEECICEWTRTMSMISEM